LVKGGHLQGEAVDLLFDGQEFREFRSPRVETKNVHGTGCTYASAFATYLAQELDVVEAVEAAKRFITEAIRHGLSLGQGHGPTNPYAAVRQEWRS
jgi:hydroxymethylpyrimidine/phosphomethylpyrimidine kinase